MKAVLISIQPQWCELIASGRKTIEVRKTCPKIETPFRCYIYCTKNKTISDEYWGNRNDHIYIDNGKVIGSFVCDRIEEIKAANAIQAYYNNREETCVSDTDLRLYLGENTGYAWHISDLKIYDKPKELGEFRKPCNHINDCCTCKEAEFQYYEDELRGIICKRGIPLTRPPQSWCHVEELG